MQDISFIQSFGEKDIQQKHLCGFYNLHFVIMMYIEFPQGVWLKILVLKELCKNVVSLKRPNTLIMNGMMEKLKPD